MLKLSGCILILLASSGMAYSFVRGLRLELRQMEQLLSLLTAMEGEITYSRCPLPDLLAHLAGRESAPFGEILAEAGRRMGDNQQADLPLLWKSVCAQYKRQLALTGESYQVLLRAGEAFSYTSLESALQMLRFGQKKMDFLLKTRQGEFDVRRKLCCCLCYTAGLGSMILLL